MQKENLLIIDDNPKNIQVVANVLTQIDTYKVYFATSGQRGIEQLKLYDFSLILLDINMPELNGYETANIIKSHPLYSNIPIIFLSANTNQESINKGFEVGGADYITKPFQELELLNRVATHIELFRTRQALKEEAEESHILLEQYKAAMDEGLLVSKTNEKGITTYVNDIFCTVSGYHRSELLDHTLMKLYHEHAESSYYDMVMTLENKKVWRGTLELKAKDGNSFFIESTMYPIFDHNHKLVEYIGVSADITKQTQLQESIIESQKEILFTFGELGELRSKETGEHVRRVALFSELLAKHYGCSEEETHNIKMASPMHDIGKVIIADDILLKPGSLTVSEFEIMKQHAVYGYEIFKNSKYTILKVAADIAHDHHEKWDGSGYPRALKGQEISIYGRIVALADVFDALSHARVYKKAWSMNQVIEYIQSESGKSFEPKLVEIFIEILPQILAIKEKYNK